MATRKASKKRKQVRPSQATGKRRPSPRPHLSSNKRAAIMAALLEGQGVCLIASTLKVPESTVRNYKRELTPAQLAALNAKRADRLDDLLWSHLESNFAAQRAITRHVQSERYIQKHNPSDLAVLFGVIDDKNIRILDAIERARRPPRDDDGEAQERPTSD